MLSAMSTRPDPDPSLRADVRLLGGLLGEVLSEQEGADFLELEERIRQLAVARRRGPKRGRTQAANELSAVLSSLPIERAEPIIRAFSTYFQLVNLAEQHHRVRRIRGRARDGEIVRGSIEQAFVHLRDSGHSAKDVREALRRLRITLTLTAHPTQAVRRTVLEWLDTLQRTLWARDEHALTPREEQLAIRDLREGITALWQADELRRERPEVGDEVKTAMFYGEEVLVEALPHLMDEAELAFEQVFGEPLGALPSPVQLHSWAGGDMDGNPRVTPEVLADTLFAHRIRGLHWLIRQVRALGEQLSQSERRVSIHEELEHFNAREAQSLPGVHAEHRAKTQGEPFRRALRFIQARLEHTLAGAELRRRDPSAPLPEHAWAGPAALIEALEVLERALTHAGAERAGLRQVSRLLDRVRESGFQLLELEMRAPAEDAREALRMLEAGQIPEEGPGRITGGLRAIARAQSEGGEAACRTLILSMAETAEDVLDALALARTCGLANGDGASIDVVPLLETGSALERGPELVRELFAHPEYRRHVEARGCQEVMVGYSDSGKEVGLLAASALLYRVQARLPEVAQEAGIPIRVFHGRGESVARGGGPAQAAILALPPGSVGGSYKATEQGEAMDHKYANRPLAQRTLELLWGGALLHTLDAQQKPSREDEARFLEVLTEMGEIGRRTYRALVWEDPDFVTFFQATTPVEELGELNIASRPAKRRAGGLEALRAIPWVFGWTQNRAILPGWYGVGAALVATRSDPEKSALLDRMYREWPYFRAIIDNVEMVLAKADLRITAAYLSLAPEHTQHIWRSIQQAWVRTEREVKRLTGSKELLDNNPTLQGSIALRNPYVDPMSFLQVELLRRKREGEDAGDRALLLSMGGIAQGLRNTG